MKKVYPLRQALYMWHVEKHDLESITYIDDNHVGLCLQVAVFFYGK